MLLIDEISMTTEKSIRSLLIDIHTQPRYMTARTYYIYISDVCFTEINKYTSVLRSDLAAAFTARLANATENASNLSFDKLLPPEKHLLRRARKVLFDF